MAVRDLGRDEGVVLRDECLRAVLERGTVGLGPPVLQAAVTVVLRALVVEAVPDLVPDDGADRAVVRGGVAVASKNGNCRIAAGNTISLKPGL